MKADNERRRFSRVLFNTPTQLCQGEQAWQCQLLDVSLHGLLVAEPEHWQVESNLPLEASIHLAENTVIRMRVRLARQQQQQLGFICEAIDLDSICHLRRLIELNLGDRLAAERDLSMLASLNER